MTRRPSGRWWVAALGALLLALVFPFIPRWFRGDADVLDIGPLVLFSGLGAIVGAAAGILVAARIHAGQRDDGGAGGMRAALGGAALAFAVAIVLRGFAPVVAAGTAALALGFALALLTVHALVLRRRGRAAGV
jgi:hypothetical protein